MRRSLFSLLLIVLIFMGSGCAMRLADMSVVSTHNVNMDKIDLDNMPQVRHVTGKDTKFVLLFIPFGLPHLEDAVEDALRKGDGDLMIDAVVHRRFWWFLIGQESLEVKGTVVKTRGVE